MSEESSFVQKSTDRLDVVPLEAFLVERLRELGKFQWELDGLKAVRQMLINDVTPKEAQQKIDDIQIEMAPQETTIIKKMDKLKAEMKPKLLEYGETVSGPGYTGAFVPGKEKVNAKKLRDLQDKYPAIEDEIEECFYTGNSSVRFVKNSKGG